MRNPLHLVAAACLAAVVSWLSTAEGPADESDSQHPKTDFVVRDVRVKLKEHRELASGRPGIVEQVFFTQGEEVQVGELIVQLKDHEVQAAYRTAKERASSDIETRYAIKAKEVSDADLAAALETNRRFPGTVPEAEIRKLRLTAERSGLQIEQAQLQDSVSKLEAEEIDAQLDSYEVRSTISGRVAKVLKEAGEGVQQGEVVVEVVSTRRLLVEGYITVSDASRVRRGCAVTVTHAGQRYGGHVVDVDRQATFVGFRVKVYAEIISEPLPGADGAGAAGEIGEASTQRQPPPQGTAVLAGLEADMTIHTDRVLTDDEMKAAMLP